MAPGSVLGLSLIVGVCLAGVVAQHYWVSDDDSSADYSDTWPSATGVSDYSEGGPIYDPSQSEEKVYIAPYAVPGPIEWIERSRDGWGGKSKKKSKKKKKKKKKKKCKKKKGKKKGKGCKKEGGWGPVTVSTDGVLVGWKGWIPPVKGAGWGWFGEKSGHFSFTDKGGWKKQHPHFPEPGPPKFIKHGPIHHKVIHKQKGWGGWHKK